MQKLPASGVAELAPILPRAGKRGRVQQDRVRDGQIIAMFRDGQPNVAIASVLGMNVKTVGNVLRRYGCFVRVERSATLLKREAEIRAFEQKEAQRDGVHVSEFDSHEQMCEVFERFREQRMRANQRSVGWELTFGQWWRLWKESGKWADRGRKHAESTVMARMGDVGPYALGNVYITTLSGNFKESWVTAPHRFDHRRLSAKVDTVQSCPRELHNATQQS